MGYTHYIEPTRILTSEEWEKFTDRVNKIITLADMPLGNGLGEGEPDITENYISFNGVGDDSHESCCIDKNEVGFSFCKTARKPYDSIVGAVYLAFQEIHGGTILSSDGDMDGDEWTEAKRILMDTSSKKKFEVTWIDRTAYKTTIEADSEEQAWEKFQNAEFGAMEPTGFVECENGSILVEEKK